MKLNRIKVTILKASEMKKEKCCELKNKKIWVKDKYWSKLTLSLFRKYVICLSSAEKAQVFPLSEIVWECKLKEE